ncbi:hypothetical protein IIU_00846 [Bacillus cereus VD133]|uniref:Transposase IS30-like HTH domain-containing protein n=1 Tax=Bacillus cereus VD133 TaxID=1053233 RepID=A0A9W5V4N2_BACCE|nr:zinc-finger domain-containing protein [Bacillus cereus]EOO39028.1 hypothetical protein IIU_00846 [Bacillus cereus VD133]
MNARETRIRILNLQDAHCRGCKYNTGTHAYCMDTCEVGKEISQLGTELTTDKDNRKTKLQWDKVCQDVIVLKNEGLTYVQIAEILGYDKGTIHRQLKKRGLLQNYKRGV